MGRASSETDHPIECGWRDVSSNHRGLQGSSMSNTSQHESRQEEVPERSFDSRCSLRTRILVGCEVADGEHLAWEVIDATLWPLEDGVMSEVTSASPRRSARVFHKMRVQAQGRSHNGRKFRETCETVVVNAYGGLLLLKHEVKDGEMLVLSNPETQEDLECRIVYLGDPGEKGQRVGIEFLTPAPHFWGLELEDKSTSSTDGSTSVN
jgi:hypothetical protein